MWPFNRLALDDARLCRGVTLMPVEPPADPLRACVLTPAHTPCSTLAPQNKYFSANWLSRIVRAELMTPNVFAFLVSPPGEFQFGWLLKLNDSNRNSRRCPSLIRKLL